MKKAFNTLIFILIVSSLADIYGGVEVSPFTENVYKRYYFIARLKKAIELFTVLEKQDNFSLDNACVANLYENKSLFYHEKIKANLEELLYSKRLDTLFDIWQDFTSYKYLEDELFLQEFTKFMLIISEKILTHILSHKPHLFINLTKIQSLIERGLRVSEVEQLDYIDQIIDFLESIRNDQNSIQIKSHVFHFNPIQKGYTQAVSQRLYYLNRLKKPIRIIFNFYKHPEVCFQASRHCQLIFDRKVIFHHERISECIELMEKTCSLKPFSELSYEFKHYKYLDDDIFVKEFSKAIFIIEKNILENSLELEPLKKYTMTHLLALYEKIDVLPLEEILNAIDLLAHELPLISQKYELDSDISWKHWLKKYWWAPPLILGTIALKLLLTVKNVKIMMQILSSIDTENHSANKEISQIENQDPQIIKQNYSSELST